MIAGWGNYVIVNPSRWGNYLIADTVCSLWHSPVTNATAPDMAYFPTRAGEPYRNPAIRKTHPCPVPSDLIPCQWI